MNRGALAKTGQLLMVMSFSLLLGRFSAQVRGDVASWTVMVGCVVVIGWGLFMLMRDFWKPDA
jgi:hypothetical protein